MTNGLSEWEELRSKDGLMEGGMKDESDDTNYEWMGRWGGGGGAGESG